MPQYVEFIAYGDSRRSRATRINALRRRHERKHRTKLTLSSKSYDETYGFLSRSRFRYRVCKCNGCRYCEPCCCALTEQVTIPLQGGVAP
jgi:hypothetical protein